MFKCGLRAFYHCDATKINLNYKNLSTTFKDKVTEYGKSFNITLFLQSFLDFVCYEKFFSLTKRCLLVFIQGKITLMY